MFTFTSIRGKADAGGPWGKIVDYIGNHWSMTGVAP